MPRRTGPAIITPGNVYRDKNHTYMTFKAVGFTTSTISGTPWVEIEYTGDGSPDFVDLAWVEQNCYLLRNG